ncbi:hypothetical protein A4X13_0g9178 [Tilletia indica]|uniref:Uncharacterized protein n=1 Tax=Tilletia indica TaxID=43049 RepID=A0A8T8SBA6_9BASI|nr:hypothetical protein A4X13_0g9178 [Tilletia indica]
MDRKPQDMDAYCISTTPSGLKEWGGEVTLVQLSSRPSFEQEKHDDPEYKDWIWVGRASIGMIRTHPDHKDPIMAGLKNRKVSCLPSPQARALIRGNQNLTLGLLCDILDDQGVGQVRISAYGFKASLWGYNFDAMNKAIDKIGFGTNRFDFGLTVKTPEIALFRPLPVGDQPFRGYPILLPVNEGEYGGVESGKQWGADRFEMVEGQEDWEMEEAEVIRLKIYSPLVHWLKATGVKHQRTEAQTVGGLRAQAASIRMRLELLEEGLEVRELGG